jgi:hypothetical protein
MKNQCMNLGQGYKLILLQDFLINWNRWLLEEENSAPRTFNAFNKYRKERLFDYSDF